VLAGRYHHRIIIPVMGQENEWLGWVGRAWVKNADRPYIYPPGEWRGTTLYNHAALRVESDEPAMVVEGCFDAHAVWPDGVAVLGKPSEWQVDAMCEAKRPVAVVLDRDAWREGSSLAYLLRARGVRAGAVRLPPVLDPDEVPGGWLREEARRCIDG
jgi:DNA primase